MNMGLLRSSSPGEGPGLLAGGTRLTTDSTKQNLTADAEELRRSRRRAGVSNDGCTESADPDADPDPDASWIRSEEEDAASMDLARCAEGSIVACRREQAESQLSARESSSTRSPPQKKPDLLRTPSALWGERIK